MTPEDEKRLRLMISEEVRAVVREEVRAALGVDQTDNAKLAALPLEERKKHAKALRMAEKAAAKAQAAK